MFRFIIQRVTILLLLSGILVIKISKFEGIIGKQKEYTYRAYSCRKLLYWW